jgi:glycosyltransferase involved in cell wall biosynthesis
MKIMMSLASWTVGKSGGDVHALEIAREWSSEHEIHFLCPTGAVPLVLEYVPNAIIHELGQTSTSRTTIAQSLNYLSRISRTRKVVQAAGDFDCFVAGSHFLPDSVALRSCSCQLRAMYVYHLSTFKQRGFSFRTTVAILAERLSLLFVWKSDMLVMVSNKATNHKLNKHFQTYFTDLGLDLQKFNLKGPELRNISVLFFARIVNSKGYKDFIKCIEIYGDAIKQNGRIVMVGTGPEVDQLTSEIARRGMGELIEYLGYVTEGEKIKLLQSTQIVLAPSYEEGWGIAIAESMAAGAVPIAYDLEVLEELFPVGLQRVPLCDHGKLGEASSFLLKNNFELTQLSESGKDFVKKYDVRRIAQDELTEIIRRAKE